MYNINKKIKCNICGYKSKINGLSLAFNEHNGKYYCLNCINKLHYLYAKGLIDKETIDKISK